ncbi:metallophosphoesterase family protein [Leifsonia sp. Leaf264]|uniref:metallophosphoesterase family protein n=1 Tax=Leifsonia sp. Leaf264 TaxID=1736314 RepID=UPI0006FEB3A4|nr:metallophosphoesterase family protein [Leifsonia sp. Leaf264]KQO98919.1 hypothetical protein ASF30_12730 [Leifsonia sp. Leaf264]
MVSLIDFEFHHVTSDHHWGHARIIEFASRPFTSTGQMNGELVARWNRAVAPHQRVIHLGDLAMGPLEESLALTGALHGDKYILPGNHDRVSHAFDEGREIEKKRGLYEKYGWTILDEVMEAEIGGRRVLLSHYPYVGDSRKDIERYAELRPVDTGLPLVHGHTHATQATDGTHPRQFHVGVDAHDFTPVPIKAIEEWLGRVA